MPQSSSPPNAPSLTNKRDFRPYAEKLLDPRWQRKRLEMFNAAGWQCQECHANDRALNLHHSFYPTGCAGPWDVPSDLLLCLCEQHHRERQSIEQQIFVDIARRLCRLNLRGLRAVGDVNSTVAAIVAEMNAAAQKAEGTEKRSAPAKQLSLEVDGQRL